MKNLPLGIQTFKDIIDNNKLYVDKTKDIYELLCHNDKYFFLSRPRRFGKSLLISTLEQIFLGNKELFKGLWIYNKIAFKKYPVIKLTMNDLIYSEGVEGFKKSLLYQLKNAGLDGAGQRLDFRVGAVLDEAADPETDLVKRNDRSEQQRGYREAAVAIDDLVLAHAVTRTVGAGRRRIIRVRCRLAPPVLLPPGRRGDRGLGHARCSWPRGGAPRAVEASAGPSRAARPESWRGRRLPP